MNKEKEIIEESNMDVSKIKNKTENIEEINPSIEKNNDSTDEIDAADDNDILETKEKDINNKDEEIDKINRINKSRKKLNIIQPIAMIVCFISFWVAFFSAWGYQLDGDMNEYVVMMVAQGVFLISGIISIICIFKRLRVSTVRKNIFMMLNLFAIVALVIVKKSFITVILMAIFIICFFYQWRYEKVKKDVEPKEQNNKELV